MSKSIHPSLTQHIHPIYDVVGIGFGPSNLALAALFDENRDHHLSAIFLEKKSSFSWHENMLIPGTEMQISFLKDIATLICFVKLIKVFIGPIVFLTVATGIALHLANLHCRNLSRCSNHSSGRHCLNSRYRSIYE